MFTEREPLTRQQATQISPVTLAFLGDAVYSVYVRERLTLSGIGKVGQLQDVAARVVSAKGQSEFLDKLQPLFTEEEEAIFRRGRNAKKGTKAKSASQREYNRSTGFEAVLGFLYLVGDHDRIKELLAQSAPETFEKHEQVKALRPCGRG